MSSKDDIEKNFKLVLEKMISLVEQISERLRKNNLNILDVDKINLVKTFLPAISGETIITTFINKSYGEFWTKISERDEEYFLKNCNDIFSNSLNSEIFVQFFTNSCITKKEKDAIWKFFDKYVLLSIKYCKVTQIRDVSQFDKS